LATGSGRSTEAGRATGATSPAGQHSDRDCATGVLNRSGLARSMKNAVRNTFALVFCKANVVLRHAATCNLLADRILRNPTACKIEQFCT
jgi:hypothetical protein